MTGLRGVLCVSAALLVTGVAAAVRYDADLGGAVRDVAGRLRPVRGTVPTRVPLAVRADAATRAAAANARRDAALAPSRLAARGRAWADIGLGDGAEPADLYLALARDLEGIGLSADGAQLLVDGGRLTEADFGGERGDAEGAALLFATGVRPDEPAVAHVMTHVLQDQRGAVAGLQESTDATLTSSAWREGEANLVALLLLYGGLGMEADVVSGRVDPASFRGGDLESPAVVGGAALVRRLLGFVYGEGFRATAAVTREGGWRSLEQATSVPGRTADLLHPGASRRASGTIPTPDLPLPDGWVLVDRDSIGEYAVGVLIAEGAGKENLGWMAAEGWEADALFRWEGADPDGGVTLWITRWSTDGEAADFRYALERTLEVRVPSAGSAEPSAPERVLAGAEGRFRVASRGREVLLRVAAETVDRSLGAILPSQSKTNTTK